MNTTSCPARAKSVPSLPPINPEPRMPTRMLFFVLLRFKRSHIDREAVLHIGLEQSLVGLVDLLDLDDFDVGGDVVFAAKIEHPLGLGDTADVRAGEIAATHDEAEGRDSQDRKSTRLNSSHANISYAVFCL